MSGFRDTFNFNLWLIYGLLAVVILVSMQNEGYRINKMDYYQSMDRSIKDINGNIELRINKSINETIMPSCFKGRK